MRSPVAAFVLRCLLWLVPCYAAWFLASPAWTRIVAAIALPFIRLFHPELASGMEIAGSDISFVTALTVHAPGGAEGLLVPDVDARTYTHGLPLFLALMLASRARWTGIAIGAAILVPVHAWGIAFDLLAQIVRMGPEAASRAGLVGLSANAVALGYQAGSLIFPVLAPVVLWVAFNRKFLAALRSPAVGRR
jgi:hypothetical protein